MTLSPISKPKQRLHRFVQFMLINYNQVNLNMSYIKVHVFLYFGIQFGSKAITSTAASSKTNSEPEPEQIVTETATIPEDITAFYVKIDKEDEDEEEDQELKTVSFEVNQVYIDLIDV